MQCFDDELIPGNFTVSELVSNPATGMIFLTIALSRTKNEINNIN